MLQSHCRFPLPDLAWRLRRGATLQPPCLSSVAPNWQQYARYRLRRFCQIIVGISEPLRKAYWVAFHLTSPPPSRERARRRTGILLGLSTGSPERACPESFEGMSPKSSAPAKMAGALRLPTLSQGARLRDYRVRLGHPDEVALADLQCWRVAIIVQIVRTLGLETALVRIVRDRAEPVVAQVGVGVHRSRVTRLLTSSTSSPLPGSSPAPGCASAAAPLRPR